MHTISTRESHFYVDHNFFLFFEKIICYEKKMQYVTVSQLSLK